MYCSRVRFLSFALTLTCSLFAQQPDRPARAVTDPGVVTTRQATTPAGVSSIFDGRILGITFGETSDDLWVLHARAAYRLDWRKNSVLLTAATGRGPGMQGLAWDAGRRRALAITADPDGRTPARLLDLTNAKPDTVAETPGASYMAGALAVQGGLAAAALTHANKLAVFDLRSGKLRGLAAVGIAPFGVALSKDGTVAWVSNWGGREAGKGEKTAPTGTRPNADQVVVNAEGIASTGTVSRVDLATLKVTHTLATGLHPSALAWDESRGRLYVANGNSDSLTVIDTQGVRVTATWPVQPFAQTLPAIAPTALAVSPSGADLYVACGGINAVAVLSAASGEMRGLIPTAWYPNALALSADGQYLAVSNLLGAGSGWRDEKHKRYVHANRGSVQVLPVPNAPQLASYTSAVGENNHLRLWKEVVPAPARRDKVQPLPVPERAGDPSLIETVVFIIKENRTYDQVLGDLSQGNGDPSLVMFGPDVTPNQHRLAEQFVLLDNFYATGGNSADGHQWLTQANEVDYCLWPGYQGRSYPFDGTDPLAYSRSGFIWDAARKAGRTVSVFGEYAGSYRATMSQRVPLLERWRKGESFNNDFKTVAPIEALNQFLAANYPSYTTAIPDVVRAKIFLEHFRRWEAAGKMPNLVMVQLPSNHTAGTNPGASTPKAMVADNDLATGQIVEALTRSAFWKKMAIFIVEDDAQNGVDHVDGHRTVALAVSPYTRRGHVDSTFYSHPSMLKTIELMLGLPSLSLFDLIATDMRASFTTTADYTPYEAVTPAQDLFEINPPAKALKGEARRGAQQSARMNWAQPDAAPSDRLNRILWHHIKGWNTPYPGVRKSILSPLAVDIDDDDRE